MNPKALLLLLLISGCSTKDGSLSFQSEERRLAISTEILSFDSGTGRFLVAPELGGRVLDATIDLDRPGVAFVNHALIANPSPPSPFHNFGGLDRLWLGPEGGPYSLFFAPGEAMDLDHWHLPETVDRLRLRIAARGPDRVTLTGSFALRNRVGTRFEVGLRRIIETPSLAEVESLVGPLPPGTYWCAFRSRNQLSNQGEDPWTREDGLLCAWVLSQFQGSPRTWVILPYQEDGLPGEERHPARADSPFGSPIHASYFGPLDSYRLRFGPGFALFRSDAAYRSKVGVPAQLATDRFGAYDPDRNLLVIVRFGPLDRTAPYVNDFWQDPQAHPWNGDAIHSYNHGGPENFFELESSSPALALAPGQTWEHDQFVALLRFPSRASLAEAATRGLGLNWGQVEVLMNQDPESDSSPVLP